MDIINEQFHFQPISLAHVYHVIVHSPCISKNIIMKIIQEYAPTTVKLHEEEDVVSEMK